ncbi:LmeA family phospholipid-binding protein [Actinomyces vulturis]|uniref:LmeA family phospholipid-binding protein n=1 Tax=Actinomyces vulturis TaxID=1857645 RepID=UPI0008364FA3|nr:LmeA family phospholipid-binding protein [Actinomyces vulturis]
MTLPSNTSPIIPDETPEGADPQQTLHDEEVEYVRESIGPSALPEQQTSSANLRPEVAQPGESTIAITSASRNDGAGFSTPTVTTQTGVLSAMPAINSEANALAVSPYGTPLTAPTACSSSSGESAHSTHSPSTATYPDGQSQENNEVSGSKKRKPRRRGITVLAVLVIVMIILGLGYVVAENSARHRIEQAVWNALPGLSKDAKVTMPSPLIPELFDDEISSIVVDGSTLVLTGDSGTSMTLEHPHIELTSLSTQRPHVAQTLNVTAVVPWSVVEDTASREHPMLPGVTFTPTQDGTVWAMTPIKDSGLELRPSVTENNMIHLAIVSAKLDGYIIPIELALDYIGMEDSGLNVDMSMLPEGTHVTNVSVGDDGMHVVIEGSNLDLDSLN